MIALYGSQNGFGWKPGEIIGAQIVSVPMSTSAVRAEHIRQVVRPAVRWLSSASLRLRERPAQLHRQFGRSSALRPPLKRSAWATSTHLNMSTARKTR